MDKHGRVMTRGISRDMNCRPSIVRRITSEDSSEVVFLLVGDDMARIGWESVGAQLLNTATEELLSVARCYS